MSLQAYLDYYPDIRTQLSAQTTIGASLQQLAQQHYLQYGHAEGRVYRRLPMMVRYTACGSIMQQHFSHVAALTIAAALGADAALPYASHRDSFGSYTQDASGKNSVAWRPVPFDNLWDLQQITKYALGSCTELRLCVCFLHMSIGGQIAVCLTWIDRSNAQCSLQATHICVLHARQSELLIWLCSMMSTV